MIGYIPYDYLTCHRNTISTVSGAFCCSFQGDRNFPKLSWSRKSWVLPGVEKSVADSTALMKAGDKLGC